MLEFNKLTLIYGLFNQYVFSEAKMNFRYLKMYFTQDPMSRSNSLIHRLLLLIEKYNFTDITEATLISTLQEDGKSDEEIRSILNKIVEYKRYTKEQAVIFRDNLRKLCYSAYIQDVKNRNEYDVVNYVESIKKFDYRSNYSDTLMAKSFSQLDITDLVDRYSTEGYKSRYDFINKSFAPGGYIPGQIVQVVAAPAVGKSLFLMGEAVNFIEQGRRVHYLTLGDLNELDIAIRMICMISKTPKRIVESDILGYYNIYKSKFEDLLSITVVPSGYVRVTEYVDWIKSRADEYDILMVDYDSNFRSDPSLNMYDQGGDTYDALSQLSRMGKLVFVASQPKLAYFRAEKLPMEAAGESSRKQHISDMIITIGKNQESSMRMGYMCIVKSRRGDTAEQPWIGTNEGLFYPCSKMLYAKYRTSSSQYHLYSYDELVGMDILDSMIDDLINDDK
jgi:KaiC/GvpD/RAD55 family RecA-like ATPase